MLPFKWLNHHSSVCHVGKTNFMLNNHVSYKYVVDVVRKTWNGQWYIYYVLNSDTKSQWSHPVRDGTRGQAGSQTPHHQQPVSAHMFGDNKKSYYTTHSTHSDNDNWWDMGHSWYTQKKIHGIRMSNMYMSLISMMGRAMY